ncbi:MAG: type II toxin-antitoxin system RelE/ParE family toxin [Candidatus Melainabacteria bacterium]|nr:type II toxin-antitoxin system RelE/ParE family toxin [Candidatus Melainabacteria bacterium]
MSDVIAAANAQQNASVAVTAHSLFLTRTADKAQKKLDKPLRLLIKHALDAICQNPMRQGERLTQPLGSVYSHHVKYQGREFRIAYQLDADSGCVLVLLIGPHENFYRSLKNLLYAS